MDTHIEIYWQLVHDSTRLLGKDPQKLERAAMRDEDAGVNSFLMAFDAEGLDDIISSYAATGLVACSSAKQKWCIGVRMKFAAGILYPFRHERDGKGNSFKRALARKSGPSLIEFLLIDMAPSIRNVVNDYIVFGS